MVVLLGGCSRVDQPQTAGHAKMKYQPAAARRALTIEQQELAAPGNGIDPKAGKPGGQLARQGVAQFWRSKYGAEQALPRQVGQQALTAHFDFREFWHCCYR